MSRLLRFSKLPAKAVATVLTALDEYPEFRDLIAEGLEEDQPDRSSWLFLARPDGWEDELGVLLDLAAEEYERASADSQLRETRRHLEVTRSTLDATRSELAAAERRVAELQEDVTRLRSTLTTRESALADLESANARLSADRDRVVANLKRTEQRSVDRLERIRELEQVIDSMPSASASSESDEPSSVDETSAPLGGESPEDASVTPYVMDIDQVGLAESFGGAMDALEQLAAALGRAAVSVGLGDFVPPTRRGDAGATPGESMDPSEASGVGGRGPGDDTDRMGERLRTSGRRSPIRLLRGAVEGSPAAIGQLLATPGVVVLVDGYNVAMQAWPLLSKAEQRDSLVSMAGTISSRSGADIHLVFDGVGDGSRPNVSAALPVRIHFSDADTEADDVILEMVRSTTGPIVVVTSDRRILDGSRRLGANVVTSTQMIEFVRGAVSERSGVRKR